MSDKQTSPLGRFLLIGLVVAIAGVGFAVVSQRLTPPETPSSRQTAQSAAPDTSAAGDGSLEGKPAPDFQLSDMQGKPVKLADLRGKVVFLNFWATWCEPCKKEMPSMERLYQRMKGRPFEILAVSLDKNPQKDIPDFTKRTGMKISFPLLAETPDEKVSKELYKTTGVPESFIIGADGQVIKHAIGTYEWDNPQIFGYIDELVKTAAKTAAGKS